MNESPASIAIEEVRGWLRERAEASDAQMRAATVIAAVDQKVAAFRLLFPKLADQLVGHLHSGASILVSGGEVEKKWDARSGGREPVTEGVLRQLIGERGGRPRKWVRHRMNADPDFSDRLRRNPNALSNAIKRLIDRGLIIVVDNLVYHPNVLNDIRSGRLEEEHLPNADARTFTSVMGDIIAALDGPFTAAEAIEAARKNPFAAEKLEGNPGAVYSWLGRQVQRERLAKDGELYCLLKRDGALNGNAASAPFAEEGATSSFENQGSRDGLFD